MLAYVKLRHPYQAPSSQSWWRSDVFKKLVVRKTSPYIRTYLPVARKHTEEGGFLLNQ